MLDKIDKIIVKEYKCYSHTSDLVCRLLKKIGGGLIFTLLLVSLVFSSENKIAEIRGEGFIRIYRGPTKSSSVVAFCREGETYSVIWESSQWVKIFYKNSEYWVPKEDVLIRESAEGPSIVGQADVQKPTDSSVKELSPPVAGSSKVKISPKQDYRQQDAINVIVPPPGLALTPKQPKTVSNEPSKQRHHSQSSLMSHLESKPSVFARESTRISKVNQTQEPFDSIQTQPVTYVAAETTFARVIVSRAPLLSDTLESSARLLGYVRKHESLPAITVSSRYVKVIWNGTYAWIQRSLVRPSKVRTYPIFLQLDFPILVALAIVGSIIILIVFIYVTGISRKTRSQKYALIISHKKKYIQDYFSHEMKTIEQCLSEISIVARRVEKMAHVEQWIRSHKLDLLIVDWYFGKNIIRDVELLFTANSSLASTIVVVYNVPDTAAVRATSFQDNFKFFGSEFTDRDIYKILMPVAISKNRSASIVSMRFGSPTLSGSIGEDNLCSVLQLIELSRKTGSMILDDSSNIGMLCFENGIIVYAATKKNQAYNAIMEILSLKFGTFRFYSEKKPSRKNCCVPIVKAIMEWAQHQDESAREELVKDSSGQTSINNFRR